MEEPPPPEPNTLEGLYCTFLLEQGTKNQSAAVTRSRSWEERASSSWTQQKQTDHRMLDRSEPVFTLRHDRSVTTTTTEEEEEWKMFYVNEFWCFLLPLTRLTRCLLPPWSGSDAVDLCLPSEHIWTSGVNKLLFTLTPLCDMKPVLLAPPCSDGTSAELWLQQIYVPTGDKCLKATFSLESCWRSQERVRPSTLTEPQRINKSHRGKIPKPAEPGRARLLQIWTWECR